MTTCIVNDFVKNRKSIIFFDANDFIKTSKVWDNEDKLLLDLQKQNIFIGKTKWSQLDPINWRVMIAQNLAMAAKLSDAEWIEATNPIIQSLHFLLCGIIVCIQKKAESLVELMHINRVGEFKVSYTYTASLSMEFSISKAKKGLRIVVDNSKDESGA